MARYDVHSTYSKKRSELSRKQWKAVFTSSVGQASLLYYMIYHELPPQNAIKRLLAEDVMPYTCILQNTDRFIRKTITKNK